MQLIIDKCRNSQLSTVNYQLRMNYTLQRKSVKYVRIKITPKGEVIVVAPMRVPISEVEHWVNTKKEWVNQHLQKIASRQQVSTFNLQENEVLILGEAFRVNFDTSNKELLTQWYKIQAKAYIVPKVQELAAKYGFNVSKIFIRDTKSKWGSCSSKDNIGLNYNLIKTPPRIIEYVIVHELCHLREFNHSPAFWSEVGKYFPEYKQAKEWLRKHEAELLH